VPTPATAAWPRRDGDHLLVTSAEMAALEEQLFHSGMPVAALMEKAALALSRRLLQRHGDHLARHGALVLVGPGHNGGDGLVIARELHLASVATAIWSPFERHKPLTEAHLRHCLWLGIQRLSQLVTAFPEIQEMDINPFVVGPEGTTPIAVDARISVEKT